MTVAPSIHTACRRPNSRTICDHGLEPRGGPDSARKLNWVTAGSSSCSHDALSMARNSSIFGTKLKVLWISFVTYARISVMSPSLTSNTSQS